MLLQVLILDQIRIGNATFGYAQAFIYPLFLLQLPVATAKILQVFLGFAIGLIIDIFGGTLGLHASAGAFAGYLRPFILQWLEPRGGYKPKAVPTKDALGFRWLMRYSLSLLAGHVIWYHTLEVFDLTQVLLIVSRAGLSWLLSTIFMGLYVFILNPRQ